MASRRGEKRVGQSCALLEVTRPWEVRASGERKVGQAAVRSAPALWRPRRATRRSLSGVGGKLSCSMVISAHLSYISPRYRSIILNSLRQQSRQVDRCTLRRMGSWTSSTVWGRAGTHSSFLWPP